MAANSADDRESNNDQGRRPQSEVAVVDVVMIGGGATGLAAATSLARFRHRVVLVDMGEPRNAVASGVHNYVSRMVCRRPSSARQVGRSFVAMGRS